MQIPVNAIMTKTNQKKQSHEPSHTDLHRDTRRILLGELHRIQNKLKL